MSTTGANGESGAHLAVPGLGDAPASAATPQAGDAWTVRPRLPRAEREGIGRSARERVPRASHAALELPADRDPIEILAAQERERLQELLPLRHARMASSPFAYYRGTPAVMAADLKNTPQTGIAVQLCGDAHLSNFGLFGSPERTLVFDANDFDETLPGPWEWDVKRLAASMVIAGRANGFGPGRNRAVAMSAVGGYRTWMGRYAAMGLLDRHYASITGGDIRDAAAQSGLLAGTAGAGRRRVINQMFRKARQRDGIRALGSLTAVVDGRRVILDDPPAVDHAAFAFGEGVVQQFFEAYRATLSEHLREFLQQYRFVDAALKVVGVGSVGTRCAIVVLDGRDEKDPLILQIKEATASVLEPYLSPSRHENHGQRVVAGQRRMQATSDILLGWTRGPEGRDYYVRQLWDMKGSVDTAALAAPGLSFYGSVCGWALARAHARTGDAVAIAAYLGASDRFDGALADFAEAYADQNAQDHAVYLSAISNGRISASADA